MKAISLFTAAAAGAALTFSSCAALAANPDELDARIAKLEEEIRVLKRLNEVKKEEEKTKAEKTPNIEYGKKGFSIASPDKEYRLALRGYAQLDGRFFLHDDDKGDVDTLLARRLRPILEAAVGNHLSFRLMPDFAGGATRIFDAYAEYAYSPAWNLRVGKFKTPIGLERLQSASDTSFIERGLPTNLVPTRDFGAMLYGEIIPDELEYQFGVFNGNADLGNTDSDEGDGKDIVARLFAQPFRASGHAGLENLGLGIAGSYGQRDGSPGAATLPDYRTPGQQRFFRYRSGTAAADTAYADGAQYRLAPQASYYYHSLGALAEYVVSSNRVRRGADSDALKHSAWQVELSYLLTGEEASFKGVKVDDPFDPRGGGWGAWELVARYGALDIDNDAFPVFANLANSASGIQSAGAGVNWYLNDNAKLMLDYEYSWFDGGDTGGRDRESEQVILSRVGVKF